jgi:hypothetical protein
MVYRLIIYWSSTDIHCEIAPPLIKPPKLTLQTLGSSSKVQKMRWTSALENLPTNSPTASVPRRSSTVAPAKVVSPQGTWSRLAPSDMAVSVGKRMLYHGNTLGF